MHDAARDAAEQVQADALRERQREGRAAAGALQHADVAAVERHDEAPVPPLVAGDGELVQQARAVRRGRDEPQGVRLPDDAAVVQRRHALTATYLRVLDVAGCQGLPPEQRRQNRAPRILSQPDIRALPTGQLSRNPVPTVGAGALAQVKVSAGKPVRDGSLGGRRVRARDML